MFLWEVSVRREIINSVKIHFSVPGRFHGFHLASAVSRENEVTLSTTYPKFEARKYFEKSIPIQSILSIEVLRRTLPTFFLEGAWDLNPTFSEYFDKSVAAFLPEGRDIFVGWSGWALHSLRKARALGMKTIIERGSSHILVQDELLKREYAKFGVRFPGIHQRTIEKELKEYEESDFISVLSRFSWESFVQKGIAPEKLLYTPLGVDVKRFSPKAAVNQPFRVLFVGSVSIRKGISYLVKAFNQLKLKDAELWIVGPLEKNMEEILKTHDLSHVKLLGPKPERDLAGYYNQASVFVMPSVEDGFGMVFTQAMASGIPVIGTSHSGVPDIVADGVEGFVVQAANADAISEKLSWCYENQEALKEMGEKGRKKILKAGSWEEYGRKMDENYRTLVRPLLAS